MSKRLFIAIPIAPELELRKQMTFLQVNMAEENIRWVKDENLHLTLKFIGKISTDRIIQLANAISIAIKNVPVLNLEIERIGIFGSSYHARVIWAGIRSNTVLLNFQKKLSLELELVGFPSDRQNYVPHFTLGRIKAVKNKDHFKRVLERTKKGLLQETQSEKCILFESILTADGPIYKTIREFKFGN